VIPAKYLVQTSLILGSGGLLEVCAEAILSIAYRCRYFSDIF